MEEMLGELEEIINEIDVDDEEKDIIEKLIDEIEEEEVENKDKKNSSDMTMDEQDASTGIPFKVNRCESASCK